MGLHENFLMLKYWCKSCKIILRNETRLQWTTPKTPVTRSDMHAQVKTLQCLWHKRMNFLLIKTLLSLSSMLLENGHHLQTLLFIFKVKKLFVNRYWWAEAIRDADKQKQKMWFMPQVLSRNYQNKCSMISYISALSTKEINRKYGSQYKFPD